MHELRLFDDPFWNNTNFNTFESDINIIFNMLVVNSTSPTQIGRKKA